MTVKEWLAHTYKDVSYRVLVRNPVICADGFRISIQGSRAHYCVPRKLVPGGEYEKLELGFPNIEEPLLREYEDHGIFPYVPIEVVEQVIEKHGGIVWVK